jgi:septal ring factor EnvC (AmiA/AmiB activator)
MKKTGNNKNKAAMTQTEVGALIEDLRSQFRIFGDGLKMLDEKLTSKIDGIATNQAKTLERVTSLEITVRKIQADISEIKTTLEKHDTRLIHLESAAK